MRSNAVVGYKPVTKETLARCSDFTMSPTYQASKQGVLLPPFNATVLAACRAAVALRGVTGDGKPVFSIKLCGLSRLVKMASIDGQ